MLESSYLNWGSHSLSETTDARKKDQKENRYRKPSSINQVVGTHQQVVVAKSDIWNGKRSVGGRGGVGW